MVAVNTRVAPAVRLAVEPLSASLLAAPITTLNVIGLPVPATNAPPEPVPDAVIVIEPGAFPVIVSVATPADAVADPRPVTVPVPALLANVTLRELSAPVVTVLPLTSWIVAVRTRVVPAVKSAVEPLTASLFAAPATTVNVIGFPAPAAKPPADALIVTVPS